MVVLAVPPGKRPNADPVIAQYELGKELGAGSFGRVHSGVHLITRRPVAVKVLHREVAVDPVVRERFVREARLAANLVHPNVVQVFDAGFTSDGTGYLVMELLDGQPLSAVLAESGAPLGLRRTAEILLPAMEGLAAAHNAGVLHRDVKPSNIFVSRAGVKVIDFGLARSDALRTITEQGMYIGTPAYMSPETLEANAIVGPATDVWSMGVILFECLTGGRPFPGGSAQLVINAIIRQQRRPFVAADAPPDIVAVVERALAWSARDRYPNMQALLDAFGDALEASPTMRTTANDLETDAPLPRIDSIADRATLASPPSMSSGTGGSLPGLPPYAQVTLFASEQLSPTPVDTVAMRARPAGWWQRLWRWCARRRKAS